jgi:serpin B
VATADERALGRSLVALACALEKQLGAQPGNIIFSPYSAATALAAVYAGAAGGTAREMESALRWTIPAQRLHPAQRALARRLEGKLATGGDTLLAADRLWVRKGLLLRPSYQTLTGKCYGPAGAADFARDPKGSARAINRWVAERTLGLIPRLVDASAFDGQTALVIVNALCLRAHWEHEFPTFATRPEAFFLAGGDSAQASTMHLEGSFAYAQRGEVRLVELRYRRDDLSLVILLPAARDGLSRLEAHLSPDSLLSWLAALREQPVDLSVPKFKIASPWRLNEPLQAMGMRAAFDPDAADFSGVTDQGPLLISDVIQRALVDIDEKGTKAAAATAVLMQQEIVSILRAGAKPVVFRANHPFLFLIRERTTGAILFFGRVADPRG